ncbi:hypothetical protein [Salininema proteolyticum]|uniref:Cell division protein FtsL n=1 Tax=Salininema proteolyticum TaxID=1607685 RepID=A0ABV8U1M5_9ACTN
MTDNGPRANADEIIRAARRRARAEASRSRQQQAALEDPSTVGDLTDGGLALDPAYEVETAPEAPAAPRTAPRTSPRPRRAAEPSRRALTAPDIAAVPRPAFVTGVISLVAVAIVGLLLLNASINNDSYRLDELKDQQASMTETEQALDDELSQLKTPNNLEAAAERLGLVEPEKVTYMDLETGEKFDSPRSGD